MRPSTNELALEAAHAAILPVRTLAVGRALRISNWSVPRGVRIDDLAAAAVDECPSEWGIHRHASVADIVLDRTAELVLRHLRSRARARTRLPMPALPSAAGASTRAAAT